MTIPSPTSAQMPSMPPMKGAPMKEDCATAGGGPGSATVGGDAGAGVASIGGGGSSQSALIASLQQALASLQQLVAKLGSGSSVAGAAGGGAAAPQKMDPGPPQKMDPGAPQKMNPSQSCDTPPPAFNQSAPAAPAPAPVAPAPAPVATAPVAPSSSDVGGAGGPGQLPTQSPAQSPTQAPAPAPAPVIAGGPPAKEAPAPAPVAAAATGGGGTPGDVTLSESKDGVTLKSGNGDAVKMWGDPHVDGTLDGKFHSFTVGKGPGAVTLKDGTRITWNTAGAGDVIDKFAVNRPAGTAGDVSVDLGDADVVKNKATGLTDAQLREFLKALRAIDGDAHKPITPR